MTGFKSPETSWSPSFHLETRWQSRLKCVSSDLMTVPILLCSWTEGENEQWKFRCFRYVSDPPIIWTLGSKRRSGDGNYTEDSRLEGKEWSQSSLEHSLFLFLFLLLKNFERFWWALNYSSLQNPLAFGTFLCISRVDWGEKAKFYTLALSRSSK